MIKKILVIFFVLFPLIAYSEEEVNKEADKASKDSEVPQILDFDARKIITTYNSVFLYGGFFYGDSLGNSYVFGADYNFNITKNFALGPSFGYSIAKYSSNVDYSQPGFFQSDNIFVLDLTGMLFNPVVINMGGAVIYADLFMIAGVGSININKSWEPHGLFGGGMRIYVYKTSVAVRVDMRTNFHSTNKPGGGNNFDQDLDLLIGVSFQIPPTIKRKE